MTKQKGEGSGGGSNSRKKTDILSDKRSLAYRVENNGGRNTDEGLRICKEAEKRAYDELGEAIELSGVRIHEDAEKGAYCEELGESMKLSGGRPRDDGLRIGKEAEKRAYQDIGEPEKQYPYASVFDRHCCFYLCLRCRGVIGGG